MAHDVLKSDEARWASGSQLLRLLDSVGFAAVGAAWIYSKDSDRWHYLLFTPMVDTKGPRWIYGQLLQVFEELELPKGITPLDIVIASPQEHSFGELQVLYGSGFEVPFSAQNLEIGKLKIDMLCAYRILPPTRTTDDVSRKFAAKVKQLVAA